MANTNNTKSRTYYAVQVGGDPACDNWGSTRKREAMTMARREARENPGVLVQICVCTTDDDYCTDLITVQDGVRSYWE